MSRLLVVDLICKGYAANAMCGLWYPFKAGLPRHRWFYCEHCGKRERATLEGTRGRWWYSFDAHRRRGVTRKQWNGAPY